MVVRPQRRFFAFVREWLQGECIYRRMCFRIRTPSGVAFPHELGHFVTRNVYEGNAEIAAERLRKRAREVCLMPKGDGK